LKIRGRRLGDRIAKGEPACFIKKKLRKKWESFIKDIDKKSLTFYAIGQLFYAVGQEKRVC